jgi:hypothetical protein
MFWWIQYMNNNKQQQKGKSVLKKKKNPNQPITKAGKALAERFSQGLKSAPVARQRVRQVAEPRFSRSQGNGDITVEHEEFIQDVSGAVVFSNLGISVNPGLIATFPWLAQMAPLYESYLFEKLEFRFESTSATTATGTIMMAVDYDASDAIATSKSQLATFRRFIRSAPWEECQCVSLLEDLRKQKTYFVRSGALAANQDIKLYDVGTLNLAVQGQADTSLIGELYVKYRVKFMTPQLLQTGVGSALSANFTGTTLVLGLSKVGNAPLNVTGTGAACTLTATAPFQCLVNYAAGGTVITDLVGSGTAAITAAGEVINSAGTAISAGFIVNFTAVGQTLVLTLTASTSTFVSVRCGQYAVSNG